MNSVVMSVHNKAHYISHLLDAIRSTTRDVELILVDDGSTDGTGEILKKYADIFVRTEDVWETKANNAGLRCATGSCIAVIQDDDLLLEDNWLERSVVAMNRHHIGVLGGTGIGHIYFKRDRINFYGLGSLCPRVARFRGLRGLSSGGITITGKQGFYNNRFRRLNISVIGSMPQNDRRIVEVDVTIRSPFIVSRELIDKIGYFDEAYAPLGYDDHAYCMSAANAGFRVATTYIHHESRFFGGSTELYTAPKKMEIFRKSFSRNIERFAESFSSGFRVHSPMVLNEFNS